MTRPRIGLDVRMVDTIETGLGRYARELVSRLPALAPDCDFVLIKRPPLAGERLGWAGNVTEAVVPGYLDHPLNLVTGGLINRLRLDLYHSLHHFLPLGLKVPRVVVTLHDLIWVEHARLTFDTRHAWLKWRVTHLYGRATMRHALAGADHVVAISRHSGERAHCRYGLPSERITVVHHGADHFLPADADGAHLAGAAEEAAEDATAPYLFSLGNSKPYKNLRGLLHAFALVARRHLDVRLLIAGRGDSLRNLRILADSLGISGRVEFCGMVSDTQVHQLFRGARALVFPSFIEGFGFPLVEAMAAGCPVVTSDIPVIREIVGEAALCADPASPAAIASAIEQVLGDAALRRQLRLAGRERASRFTWAACAARTAAVHRRLLEADGR
ncbi:MAG: glycosyltransferase family 4 protein [Deltaproteobacteria bacterium]|nr:glycosyltransferase family 4 protein [Deltaproteobacteria bacterium]